MNVTVLRVSARPTRDSGASALLARELDDAGVAAALAAGVLPVETHDPRTPGAACWLLTPAQAAERARAGLPGWRMGIRHVGARADVLDALARTRAAYLLTEPGRVVEAASITGLPGLDAQVSVPVDDVAAALAAVDAGAADLVVEDWDDAQIGELREALAPLRLAERVAFPPGLLLDVAREVLARPMLKAYLDLIDAHGLARPRGPWAPGVDIAPPVPERRLSAAWADPAWVHGEGEPGLDGLRPELVGVLERSLEGVPPTRDEIELLFRARSREVEAIAAVADTLRARRCGDTVSYVVNRNINYTNQCYFRCGFCGFSRGPKSLNLRGAPYLLSCDEVVERSVEAWERGATEVCLQGGIHPDFDGDFYLGVLSAIKERLPRMHVHGFTALEVWQGAQALGMSVRELLTRLRDAGLGSLPGTAAEVLDDRIRLHLCPDKIRSSEWADVHVTAHELGLRSNVTLMFGHIDDPAAWANHLELARQVQRRTGGFTEFVPLPFVHMASPIYLQGRARPGPTWDEVVLVHAVGRIAFDGMIENIQASWVKLGLEGGGRLLAAGCNDLGGTLMDENISRASGAAHGQLATPEEFEAVIRATGRVPARRSTLYESIELAV